LLEFRNLLTQVNECCLKPGDLCYVELMGGRALQRVVRWDGVAIFLGTVRHASKRMISFYVEDSVQFFTKENSTLNIIYVLMRIEDAVDA
jgi:hypothetical protein